ncbi:MAG: twin-arginine translocase TatA/TatE family subunit [Verrucomicrobiota bacterium]
MFGLGSTELIVIGVIVFFIFGAKRLPDIGKGLGGAIREFRKVKKDISLDEETGDNKDKDKDQEQKNPATLESKLTDSVMKQIPGVKKVVDVKEKVEKMKDIMKT